MGKFRESKRRYDATTISPGVTAERVLSSTLLQLAAPPTEIAASDRFIDLDPLYHSLAGFHAARFTQLGDDLWDRRESTPPQVYLSRDRETTISVAE